MSNQQNSDWDAIDQASMDSFPASDPPSHGGHAVASESTALGEELASAPTSGMPWRTIALGAGAVVVVAGIVVGVRMLRAR